MEKQCWNVRDSLPTIFKSPCLGCSGVGRHRSRPWPGACDPSWWSQLSFITLLNKGEKNLPVFDFSEPLVFPT